MALNTVADLGEGPRAAPYFGKKKIKKCRRKKSRQSKRYTQINFVSTSQKNRAPPPLYLKVWIRLWNTPVHE